MNEQNQTMNRYSLIQEKNKREIILLRGSGCQWRRCRFCDYYLDFCTDAQSNFTLNCIELQKVTGIYHKLEVINSGSFIDLDEQTMNRIEQVCTEKSIKELHVECHYMHKDAIPVLKSRFAKIGVAIKIKIGVETFDSLFRESYLDKGIVDKAENWIEDASIIAADFDEVCLLFGIPGQTLTSMTYDIETGLQYFERICINIMVANSKNIKPDPRVISIFVKELYPKYIANERVDILMENTDFGIGETTNE